jgi:transposase-like protein
MENTTEVIRVDESGRVRTPREKQEEAVDGFERSGMTGMQFARHIGVKYPTLMYWVQRRRRERGEEERPAGQGGWLEAVVEPGGKEREGLVVEVPGGMRLVLREGSQIKLAVEFLREWSMGQPC